MKNRGAGFLPMAIGIVIILLGISLAQFQMFYPGLNSAVLPNNSTSTQDQIPGWKTYRSQTGRFSFQYPPDFQIGSTTPAANTELGPVSTSTMLVVPLVNYFHTRVTSQVRLTIYEPSEVCPGDIGDISELVNKGKINSSAGSFDKYYYQGVGAGQLYETWYYALVPNVNNKDDTCYPVVLLIHSANDPGVYPDYDTPEKIKTAADQQSKDKTAFTQLIDKMVSTYKLTK